MVKPPPADPLAESVEKAMRDLGLLEDDRGVDHVPLKGAVSVALALVRRERELAEGIAKSLLLAKEMCDREHPELAELRERAEAAEKERDDATRRLAEYREKWGHVRMCSCCLHAGQWTGVDPRCAPEDSNRG